MTKSTDDIAEAAPVAWRVKDFADGWIVYGSEKEARFVADETGAVMQPLYAREAMDLHEARLIVLMGENQDLRKSAKAKEWRPIESAPKDGTQILAYAKSEYDQHFYGVAEWATARDWDARSIDGWFWTYAIRPTHWRQLPEPPSHSQSTIFRGKA
jgi:hypothetical protein